MTQGFNVREAATRLKVGKTALYEALATAEGKTLTMDGPCHSKNWLHDVDRQPNDDLITPQL